MSHMRRYGKLKIAKISSLDFNIFLYHIGDGNYITRDFSFSQRFVKPEESLIRVVFVVGIKSRHNRNFEFISGQRQYMLKDLIMDGNLQVPVLVPVAPPHIDEETGTAHSEQFLISDNENFEMIGFVFRAWNAFPSYFIIFLKSLIARPNVTEYHPHPTELKMSSK